MKYAILAASAAAAGLVCAGPAVADASLAGNYTVTSDRGTVGDAVITDCGPGCITYDSLKSTEVPPMTLRPAADGWVSDPFMQAFNCLVNNTTFDVLSQTHLSADASRGWTTYADRAAIDRQCPGPEDVHQTTWTMVRK
jgi:hypothetical protein